MLFHGIVSNKFISRMYLNTIFITILLLKIGIGMFWIKMKKVCK